MTRPAGPDESATDYRERYELPEHFVWDEADRPRIQYDGYARIVQSLLPPPPLDVLDAGCGDGFFARRLLGAGYEVWGVDYSERAIGFARILAGGGTFQTFDLRRLGEEPLFERRFGAAVLMEVLEHVPPGDRPRVLGGLARALRPDGCLVASMPSVHLAPRNSWHHEHFDVEGIRALFARAGFAITDLVCQRPLVPLWSPRVWRLLKNRYYDCAVARRLLRRLLLARFNVTSNPDRAGRYVVRGVLA